MVSKIMVFFVLIFVGLSLGYGFKRLHHRLPPVAGVDLAALRRRIQRSILLFGVPTISLGTLWIADLEEGGLGVLPFLGVVQAFAGGAAALAAAGLMGLQRRQKGSLFCSGFFTNLGSFGGLAVYLLLGEASYAYVLIYKLLNGVIFYGIGFPVAKRYSPGAEGLSLSPSGIARQVFSDSFVIAALAAMALGAVLNILGVPRPGFYSPLNAVLIPGNALLMLFTIGLGMRFGKIGASLRVALAAMGIKFILSPLVVVSAAFLLGLRLPQHLPVLQVVLILSAMPPAFTSVIPPSLYNLDLDMANTCWLLGSLAIVAVMPLLGMAISRLG